VNGTSLRGWEQVSTASKERGPTQKDAEDTVNRVSRAYDAGSAPRMGSRHVDIELR
jgi:hypothetical protein